MQSRLSLLFLAGAVAVGCAPAADEQAETPPAAAAAEPAATADEAAIDQIRSDYVTHYNMQHADVVANLYTDSAFALWASGDISEGRSEIQARLEADLAGSPALDLQTGDVMVFGDNAVGHGTWSVSATPEGGEAMNMSGHYMTAFTRQGGEWKVMGVITNYNAPAPPDMLVQDDGEEPPEDGTMGDLVNAYEQAFNAGDAAAVAALYTADGFHAFANLPVSQGPQAIQSTLAERFAAGKPTIDIHDVGTLDLGNGYALDGGWYRMTAPGEGGATMTQGGTYMNLVRQQPDGSWKIQWGVSNGNPQQ